MIRLDTVNKKLRGTILSGAGGSGIFCLTNYSDKTSTAYTGASGTANLVTAYAYVDLCSFPSSGTVRDVDHICIRNADTNTLTFSLQYFDAAGVSYEVVRVIMAPDDLLIYTHGHGWVCLDKNGAEKTTAAGGGGGGGTAIDDRDAILASGMFSPPPPRGEDYYWVVPKSLRVAASTPALTVAQGGSGGGVTVESGGVTVQAGGVTVQADGVEVQAGGVAVQAGGLVVEAGDVVVGDAAGLTIDGAVQKFQLIGDATDLNFAGTRCQDSASGMSAYLCKSRGTAGSPSIVQSGDILGSVICLGNDGTGYKYGASIVATVDDTPGSGSMPTRLSLRTTPTGSVSSVERVRVDKDGQVAIGGATSAGYGLYLRKDITGATTSIGAYQAATILSGVTGAAYGFRSDLSTQATAFTVPNLYNYYVNQGTIGAGSAVTAQYGFAVSSNMVGGGTNYGFHSALPSGATNWNFYASGTASNYFSGSTGVGSSSLSGVKFRASNAVSAAAATNTCGYFDQAHTLSGNNAFQTRGVYGGSTINQNGFNGTVSLASGGNVMGGYFQGIVSGGGGTVTAAVGVAAEARNTFTGILTNGVCFHAWATNSGGGTFTNAYGYYCTDITTVTNVYGFYGNVSSGANKYNIYMGGTAANYFAGDMQFNKTITAAGTTGARTINKNAGSVNFAAAATSLVVTNSLVTANSVIVATVGTNDSTMKSVAAVAAAGSFTLYANAAATAETRVNFIVIN